MAHARNVEQAEMYVKVNDLIQDLQHVRYSRVGEGKDMSTPEKCGKHSKKKKKNRCVTRHEAYKLQYKGETWIVKRGLSRQE